MITIPKGGREEIRVDWTDFQGERLLMGRVFYQESDGTWRPGKQGMNLSPELWVTVAAAVLKLAGVDTPAKVAAALADVCQWRWQNDPIIAV